MILRHDTFMILINYKIYIQFPCPEIALISREFEPFWLRI